MEKEQSEHEKSYRKMHACVMAHILEDAKEMTSFHAQFAQHPDIWTRALACGFYRMGYQHLELIGDNPPDFYDLDADDFVQNIFALELAEDAGKFEVEMKLPVVRKGFDAVLKYDQIDAGLHLDEMKNMAIGLGKLVLFYPSFFDEAQREGILEDLSFNITEDLLGEWPAD